MEGNVELHFVGMRLVNEKFLGPEIVPKTCEKIAVIRERLQAVQSR
jgi:hypothetical protein